jgi:hypothetical protein
MLDRDREQRFESCDEVVSRLADVLRARSKSVGAAELSEFVRSVLGRELQERRLEAASDANFVISFDPTKDERKPATMPLLDVTKGEELSAPQARAFSGQEPARRSIRAPPLERSRSTFGRGIAVLIALTGALSMALVFLFSRGGPLRAPEAPAEVRQPELPGAAVPPAPSRAGDLTGPMVESSPPGAEIEIDGRPIGVAPIRLEVDRRKPHRLRATKAGYLTAAIDLSGTDLEAPLLKIALSKQEPKQEAKQEPESAARRSPPPPPPPQRTSKPAAGGFGLVTIRTTPWSRVWVDGADLGSTPIFKVKLPVGTHEVRMANEEQKLEARRTITVRADETTKLDIALKE